MNIIIPKELDHLQVVSTITNPLDDSMGILILGENMDAEKYAEGMAIIRIYHLSKIDDEFEIDLELQAFAFPDIQFAQQFAERLPNMSALEMFIAMYGPQNQHNQKVH